MFRGDSEGAMGGLLRVTDAFDGETITTILYKGKPVWIAREVGKVLGYAKDGKGLANHVRGDWAEEFDSGDVILLEGKELQAFERLIEGTESMPSKGGRRALLLLTESGVHLACLLSRKPEGRRLRRWLATEVLPSLRATGAYEMPDPVATERLEAARAREARLLAQQRARGFTRAAKLARKLGKGLTLEQYYEARAAACEAGEELPRLMPSLSERTWTTEDVAKELAEEYGVKVSSSSLGKYCAKDLKVAENGRLAEAARKHSEGACEIWRWNARGVARLKEAWVSWMIGRGKPLTRVNGQSLDLGVA